MLYNKAIKEAKGYDEYCIFKQICQEKEVKKMKKLSKKFVAEMNTIESFTCKCVFDCDCYCSDTALWDSIRDIHMEQNQHSHYIA